MRVVGSGLAALVIVVATLTYGAKANASDGPLLATLDRLKCVPARISQLDGRPEVTLYEVSCKRSERVIYIACTSAGCMALSGRAPDDEK